MAESPIFYYRVSSQVLFPIPDPQIFHLGSPTNTQTFLVQFCLSFATQTPIPSSRSSIFISQQQFFQHGGPAVLRSNLSHPMLPTEVLDVLIPIIMDKAKQLFDHRSHERLRNPFRIFPLAVDIIVDQSLEEAEMQRIMWESMQEAVRMVSASKEAIESLNKVKVEEDAVNTKGCCCICLEEFDKGVELSAMPCQHIYHNDCIVQWLKTSHVCPLCRYPLAVANNS